MVERGNSHNYVALLMSIVTVSVLSAISWLQGQFRKETRTDL